MSLSSMCFVAWKHGYKYNWTRCDWIPDTFVGGQVLFTGNKVKRDVVVVDFTSMYPSIIRDGGISPECIDYIDLDKKLEPRFDYLICLCYNDYNRNTLELNIGAAVLGVNDGLDTDATGNVLVGEEHSHLSCQLEDVTSTCSSHVDSLLTDVCVQDGTLQNIPKKRCVTSTSAKPGHPSGLDWYVARCRQLAQCAQETKGHYRYVFSADKATWKDGMVDWVAGPLDSTMVFTTDSYIARFCPGPRICAEACETLMNNRQRYRRLMEREGDPTRKAVYNRTQHALKICANSMYGAMSFRHYNSYSPRCGTSVTGSGRWSLNVSAAVVSGLGFEVVYGDTDSVMYTLDFDSNSNDLIHLCAKNVLDSYTDLSTTDLMEFISGNEHAFVCSDKHLLPISNIVVKVLNKVMSYTCFGHLCVEQQVTESTAPRNYKSVVFPSFMVTSKKHYVGMKRDGELYTKGMNYIRRSGCALTSITTQEFVRIVLAGDDLDSVKVELSRSCYSFKTKVKNGKYLHLLNINMKYLGRRGNYVRVRSLAGGGHQYIGSNSILPHHRVDVNYYMKRIRTSLNTVTSALNIDLDLIYTGTLVTYRRDAV